MAAALAFFAKDIAIALGAGLAYEAVNNYISKSPNPDAPKGAPDIPIAKPTSPNPNLGKKIAQKQALGNFATGVAGLLSTSATAVNTAVTNGKTSIEALSTAQSAKTAELLTPSQVSPLLTNQVFIKDSIDKLIDAINSNTLVSATVFGTLDQNISSLGSSLTAISATLIEIADNYQEDLDNTGDTPYINSSDYYKMLSASGVSEEETQRLSTAEKAYVDGLRNQNTSYSDIKKAVLAWRKTNVPATAQQSVDDEINGLTSSRKYTFTKVKSSLGEAVSEAVPTTTSPSLSATIEVPNLEKWAESAFSINTAIGVDKFVRKIDSEVQIAEFKTTAIDIKDLEGNVIKNVKPMEAQAIKNITDARYRTDINNFDLDSSDFDDMFDGDLPDLSSIFDYEKLSTRLSAVKASL